MASLKRRLFQILSVSSTKRDFSWYFDLGLITLIVLNVLAVVLESVPSLEKAYYPHFQAFEYFSVVVFSIEYLLRVWTITEAPEYAHPVWGRLRYIFSLSALIDLAAILPFYAGVYVAITGSSKTVLDTRFIRILRLFRLFRLLKVLRYVAAMQVISNVFKAKKEELIISLTFILFMLLVVSCGMYYVERDVPDTQFVSIPATMWWGVATLTTVGYGDIYPVTPMGKFLGGAIAILGIGLFALPTGILAAGTSEEIERAKLAKMERKGYCSCCGKPLDSEDIDH